MKKTFALIKPDVIETNLVSNAIKDILDLGFSINKLKRFKMSRSFAENFYSEHKGKPFFDNLIKFMTSNDVIALELEKENAIEHWRDVIGSVDPHKREHYHLRTKYATDQTKNAFHGSDSDTAAQRELALVFANF